MNKKSLLGLILFACLITMGLFASANFLINQGSKVNADTNDTSTEEDNNTKEDSVPDSTMEYVNDTNTNTNEDEVTGDDPYSTDIDTQEPWLTNNPSDTGVLIKEDESGDTVTEATGIEATSSLGDDTFSTSIKALNGVQLIYDCDEVDYMSYVPEMMMDSQLEMALDINNPSVDVEAEAAILFDANTKEILFCKNAVQAVFPASTVKLLTALVALKYCSEAEEITIGDEITMIASDSTTAYLSQGQILTMRDLLEAMLLPSGNDAAYAIATYIGRKSLVHPNATKEEAVLEFARLMNMEANSLGVKNSCFMTPDGYDAIGQYTTAYDMGLIGIAAATNKVITEITQQGSLRNIYVSGEDITLYNTNKLVKRYSGQYYSNAIGLKTGTSTMAGRCLVAAAENEGKRVVSVIMDSSSAGRWEDAIELLKYGLGQ